MGWKSTKEGIDVYIQLSHFAAEQKLTQHCKAVIPNRSYCKKYGFMKLRNYRNTEQQQQKGDLDTARGSHLLIQTDRKESQSRSGVVAAERQRWSGCRGRRGPLTAGDGTRNSGKVSPVIGTGLCKQCLCH